MRLFVFLLTLFFATPVFAKDISGLWICSDSKYYYFNKNGDFTLPNSKIQTGISWEYHDNILTLRYVYVPASDVIEAKFKVEEKKDKLIVTSETGEVSILKRTNKKIKIYSGEIYYRERMKLPPKVEVRYALYKNDEKNPFMLTSVLSEGKTPLPFKLYYLADKKDKITIQAKIYHDFQLLFSTDKPVSIDNKNILLYRQLQENDIEKMPIPSKYISSSGDVLFLEKKGLAILQSEGKNEIAHWSQIDRNHTLEITKNAEVPFTAPITDTHSITFKFYNGKENVTFIREDNEFFHIGTFELIGEIYKKDNSTFFMDCITSNIFPIKLEDVVKKKLGNNLSQKPSYVRIGCALSRNKDGSLDLYAIEIKEVLNDMACTPVYQAAVFENTYWRLKTLNSKDSQSYDNQIEAHFILRDKMISGSDGCNNFFMPVEYEGNSISFKEGGSTLMLCPHGEEQAREFINTLHKVTHWEIKGSLLKLLADDRVVATFEAVYF